MSGAVSSYDFVQLIEDNDWKLVGIVPKGNSSNNSKITHNNKLSTPKLPPIPTIQKSPPEATIVNRRRIVTRRESTIEPTITRADTSLNLNPPTNPNILSGINSSEAINNYPYNKENNIIFGEISNLAVLGRDNLLVGFGKN